MFKEILRYLRFIKTYKTVCQMEKDEMKHIASCHNGKQEQKVDDACKRVLFREVAKGDANKDYVQGYLQALAVRKRYTYPDWDEQD
jgi:hypothetical protein